MSRRTLKSLGLSILAAALAVTFTPNAAVAQDASVVKTVPAVGAPALITGKVDDNKLTTISSPAVYEGAKDLGPASPDMKMGLQFRLHRSDAQHQALNLLNQQVQDPKSGNYGKVMSPTEFAQTFGLAASDLATLKSQLESAGFTVGNVDNGRMTIDFEGTVAQVNAAFHTDIHNYLANDGTQHYAAATDLQLPKAIVPAIESIAGLQNFVPAPIKSFGGPVTDFTGVTEKIEASASGKAIEPKLTGEALHDSSFTASKYVLGVNGSTTLNVRIGGNSHPVTGSLAIEDLNNKVVGYVADITKCEPYNGGYGRSCTADYQPAIGTAFLKAVYSGDETHRGLTINGNVISRVGTAVSFVGANFVSSVSTTPLDVFTGNTSGTVTAVLTYVGAAPTSTDTMTTTFDTGGGAFASSALSGCTASAAAVTYTCSLADANAYSGGVTAVTSGFAQLDTTFSGDATYASTIGYTGEYVQANAASITPTYTATGAATSNYGVAAAPSVTLGFTETGGGSGCGSNAKPSYTIFQGASGTGTVATPQLMGSGFFDMFNGSTSCSKSGTTYSVSGTIALAGSIYLPPGTYNIGTYYTGNTALAAGAGTVAGKVATGTDTLTVSKGTATMGTVTASPTSAGNGQSTAITLSDAITFPGVDPSGAVTFTVTGPSTVTGSPFTATCVAGSSPETCSATIPGSVVAGLSNGTYTAAVAFAGDNFYNSATGTSGTFKILPGTTSTMTSPTAASPKTEAYAALSAFTVTGQIAYTSATAPTTATFSSTAAGAFGTVTCTGSSSPVTCSATFTPTATDIAGSYNINLVFAGDANNAASSSSVTGNFIISKGTFTTVQMTTSTYTTPPTATTQAYGSTTPFSVYATLSPSGTVAPTAADVVFSTSTAGIGTFGTPTCAVVSAVAQCTATFTPNGTATPGSYNINVSFTGDTNYNSGGPSTNGTGLYVVTNATPTVTFNPSPITSTFGSTTPISVTVTVSNNYTGVVNFTGTYATYGTLSATSCTITVPASGCSVTFTPNGTTAVGTYTSILTATAPAAGFYNTASANDNLVIAKNTTALAMTVAPIAYYGAQVVGSGAFTVVLSWTNPALEPTGTIAISDTTSSRNIGTITLSATGAAIASTACVASSASVGTCTYTCAAKSDLAISCTVTNTATSGTNATTTVADTADGNTMVATYSGDTNYASTTGNTYLYNQYQYAANGDQATITLTGTAIANATYGLTTAESPTVSINDPDGTPPSDSTFPFLDITSTGATGTMYEINLATCSTNPCVTATSWNFPAVVAPGTYALSYNYSGNYQSASGDADQTTLASGSVIVAKGTPTMGTVTFSPASTEPYGTNQAIVISDTLTYLGVGEAPQGAVTYTLNSVGYTATCTLTGVTGSGNTQSNVETCTATVPGTVIAALAVNTYTVTAAYTTDTNYAAATGTSATFTITTATPALALTPSPITSVYGSVTGITITATATGVAGGTTPGGVVTFSGSYATYGTLSSTTCTLSAGSCTVTFTPNGTTAVGSYSSIISATEAANGNYGASAAATDSLTITTATATLSLAGATNGSTGTGVTSDVLTATLSPASAGSTVTFTDVTTGATIGTATTNASGVASITVNTAGNGSGQSSTPSGGKNLFSAAATATSNTGAASTTSNTTTYFQGILFTFIGTHNFSGLLTGSADPYSCCTSGVEGTVDGTSAGQYGVSVFNFTTSSQTLPVSLTNAPSGAFSLNNQCGSTLSAGEACSLVFSYAPPAGDGCTPAEPPTGSSCTLDGSGYPQGTYESGTWTYTLPMGVIAGLGNQGFTTSGVVATSGIVAGKALLEPLSLNVSPTTVAFGSVAQGSTTQTITVTVQNTNSSAVPFTVSGPNGASGTSFTVNNTCNTPLAANSSCSIYISMVTTTVGTFSGDTITITPSGGTAVTINLSGTVVASSGGITLSSNNHNFGSVTDGTTASYSVSITNNTSSSATLTFNNSAGTGYSTSTTCNGTTLAAMSSCTYYFTFAPTTPGAATDTLTITSNVPILPGSGGDTGTVTVNGTGVAGGHLTATSVTHNWGTIAVGTSGGNYGVEITNSTASAVTLSFSGLTGGSSGFSVVGTTCGASLAVNANCELMFTFTPNATGFVSGTYPITSSSPLYFSGNPVSPSQITLEGTGD